MRKRTRFGAMVNNGIDWKTTIPTIVAGVLGLASVFGYIKADDIPALQEAITTIAIGTLTVIGIIFANSKK